VFCVGDRGSREGGSGATAVFCVGDRGSERRIQGQQQCFCWGEGVKMAFSLIGIR
jgi:hypothetical protein